MSSVGDLSRLRRGRARATRRRRLRLIAIVAAVVLVLGATGWLVWFSPVLALKQVSVTGTSLLTTDEVTRQAAAPIGRPLVRVAEQPIADRVAQLPQVESVHVQRRWPSGLAIEVTERRPAYAIAREGRWLLVDGSGTGFVSLAERPEKLIEVRTPISDPATLALLAKVTGSLPEDIQEQLDHVEAPRPDAIKLVLREEREIFFGSGADAELKIQVAGALLRATKAKWIDVSAPGHPATR